MAKDNRTLEMFSDNLDEELNWRRKELTILYDKLPKQKNSEQPALLRANYVMLYAHWEGFTKAIFQHYIDYVKLRKLTLKELKPCFIARIIRPKGANEKGVYQEVSKIEFLINGLENRAYITDTNVSTKSNLRFGVFVDILAEVGLTIQNIEPIERRERNFSTNERRISTEIVENEIDKLVDVRNEVAHGKYLLVSYESFIYVREITMTLMENVKNKLYQAALQEKYKK
ncbi:MAE_28990/MAE_18760 family HEPN-like nuclease [Bernardetia sp. ABR2-2B]|uniref:MAE_28990/MAE_18760 family HEPN-like nuclease n=1 Tax=Bernardetia sp. ABR2-2B TaxID=3127472 RepID=UPI0030CD5E4E